MREPLEMVTASLMQNMVQIRKKNIYFVTIFSPHLKCGVLVLLNQPLSFRSARKGVVSLN